MAKVRVLPNKKIKVLLIFKNIPELPFPLTTGQKNLKVCMEKTVKKQPREVEEVMHS